MKRFFNWLVKLFSRRRNWVRQITVAAIASATAWVIGDALVYEGGVVAAIMCALSIRISLYKSIREGLGLIVGKPTPEGGVNRGKRRSFFMTEFSMPKMSPVKVQWLLVEGKQIPGIAG